MIARPSTLQSAVRIHVVDADASFHRTLRTLVAQSGGDEFQLTFSRSLPRAIAAIRKNGIDACLVDHGIASTASGNQLEALEAALGHRPVILLTETSSTSATQGATVWKFASDSLYKRALTPDLVVRAVRYAIEVNATRRALIDTIEEFEQRVQSRTDQLKQRNEELELFATLVAHDLQAPLKTVLEQCRSWKCDTESCTNSHADEFCSHFANQAVANVERVSCLVQRLLEYSRVGRDGLKPAWVSLNDVVRAALDELDGAIQEAGAIIQCGDLPVAFGDYWLLVDVFENLFHNALKFRADQPLRIYVKASTLQDEWEIRVEDNGIGLDAKGGHDIFALFSRNAPSASYPGDGIGLATCRKIINHHGGRIWAEPKADGGAVFCFTLPRRASAHDCEIAP